MSEEEKQATELLAVSVDARPELQKMVDRISKEDGIVPDFPLLSDPGHRVIDRYGLFNPNDRRNIPHPATYLIDKQGVVRWKFVEVDYKVRPSNETILEALRALR